MDLVLDQRRKNLHKSANNSISLKYGGKYLIYFYEK
jgi:hypothetical protein